jgi:ABC-2 type transport system permease protein
MALNQVELSPTILLLPLDIAEIYLFALGVSLFLAAMYVKFRDVSYIWEVVLQAGFYATPIIYPLSMITVDFVQKLLLISPIAQAIQNARYNVVTHSTITSDTLFESAIYIVAPLVIVVAVLVGGIWYFRKQSRYFAENI